ncbi:MAG: J domain-containing protein [Pseudomonadota bacterium]|nr:J domain-containing protein [Pseudomonadota bacterium]
MAATPLARAYTLLGLAPDASEEEIKRAWRALAKATHPDLNPDDPDAGRRFREAEAAHALLTDPARRAEGARAPREGPDDDWFDGCAWMAEAHLIRLRRDVLPRYAARHRGGPSLVSALAAHADRGLSEHAPGEAPSRWARAWAWYLWRHIELVVDEGPPFARGPVGLVRVGARVRILLWPRALWAEGIRDDDVLRTIVQRSVDLGVAAAAPVVLGVAMPPTFPYDEADRWWWAGKLFWPVVLVLVAAFSIFLIGSGMQAGNGPIRFR